MILEVTFTVRTAATTGDEADDAVNDMRYAIERLGMQVLLTNDYHEVEDQEPAQPRLRSGEVNC